MNLAEARGRVRALRRRERAARDGLLDDSVAEALARLRRAGRDDAALDAILERLRDHAGAHRASDRGPASDGADRAAPLRGAPRAARRPAAHPVRGPRGPPAAARGDHAPVADVRPARRGARAARRGAHGDGRVRRDAVHARAAAVPATDAALDAARLAGASEPGTRPPRVPAFLRFGSWIGGDRDGNPAVTAEMTERTLRIQADHVLHGYEAVAMRLMQTVSAATASSRVARPLAQPPGARRRGAARDRPAAPPPLPGRAVPPALRVHRRAAAPHARDADGRHGPPVRALRGRRGARRGARRDPGRARRRRAGAGRLGRGRRAPLAARDVRVPPRLARGPPAQRRPSRGPRRRSRDGAAGADTSLEVAPGCPLAEVLATFRSIAALQERFGEEACRRFVVSFTPGAGDATDVLRLARHRRRATARRRAAAPRRRPAVRVVRRARPRPGPILDELLRDPGYRATSRPAATARR